MWLMQVLIVEDELAIRIATFIIIALLSAKAANWRSFAQQSVTLVSGTVLTSIDLSSKVPVLLSSVN